MSGGGLFWRLHGSLISSLISTTLVVYALGSLLLLLINAQGLSEYVREHVSVSLVLREDTPRVDAEFLRKSLDAAPYVKRTEYISKERAAEELTESLGQDFLSLLQYNPLSPSIELHFQADWANGDSISRIARDLLESPLVSDVRWEPDLVDAVNANVRRISALILGFCAVMSFIAVVLIHHTIRLRVYARRFLIKTMQLVGATAGFVRGPFVRQAVGVGVISSLLAFGLLLQTVRFLQRDFYELINLSMHDVLALVFGFMMGVSVLLMGLTTGLSVSKYLRSGVDELYY